MNAIGVDVGGTKIAAAVVSPEGKILNEVRYPTQAVPPNRLVGTIAQAVTEVKDGFEVGGVCLAVPGLILASENKVIFSPNLHEIEDIRLDEEMGDRTGLRVTVENDANAAAWGEFRYGAGADVDHQVFITLGTGVGGGVITHGVLLRGAQGAGGEMGRLAIERQVLGEDVTRLAQEGDEAAISVLEETGMWLGIGLAGFVNIFNPEVIAVGGGAARAGELILGPARKEIQRRSRSPSRDLVEIREATLGPESGVLGAAGLARGEDGEYVLGPSKRLT